MVSVVRGLVGDRSRTRAHAGGAACERQKDHRIGYGRQRPVGVYRREATTTGTGRCWSSPWERSWGVTPWWSLGVVVTGGRTLVVAIGAVAIGLVARTRGWIGARVEGAPRARSRWCFPVARSGRSRRQPRERRRHPVCGLSHMALSRSCGHLELTTALTTTATTHRLGTSPSPCHVLHPHITPTERWVVRGTSPSRGTPMPD